MIRFRHTTYVVLLALLLSAPFHLQARQLPSPVTFAPGDIFVSLEYGEVLWFAPDGTLRRVLPQTWPGTAEAMAFDAGGSLLVSRWCNDPFCIAENGRVESYNNLGLPQGKQPWTFNCSPRSVVFGAAGATYVGQVGCNRSILKFVPGETVPTEYFPQEDNEGVFWMDLAPDGCTMFYTSMGPNVKRYDVCSATQLPDFNVAALPGGVTHDVRLLPDGGVLVSSGEVVARLNSDGVLTQTYGVPPEEPALWVGFDFADNGAAFWVGNYHNARLHKFNLQTGEHLATISVGTPANSIIAVKVAR
jgi:hypothetical protein